MTKDEIALVLERAGNWPEEAQMKLIRAALAIEQEHSGVYSLDDAECSDLNEALAEFEHGDVASDSETSAVFRKLRGE